MFNIQLFKVNKPRRSPTKLRFTLHHCIFFAIKSVDDFEHFGPTLRLASGFPNRNKVDFGQFRTVSGLFQTDFGPRLALRALPGRPDRSESEDGQIPKFSETKVYALLCIDLRTISSSQRC